MSSPSIAPIMLHSVTTTPNVFEFKSTRKFRGCDPISTELCSHRRVVFGDLARLKRVCEANRSYWSGYDNLNREFLFGNYSISVIRFDEQTVEPMVIMHLENVDPTLVAEKLMAESYSNTHERDSSYRPGQNVLRPMDWFCARRLFVNTSVNHDKQMKMDSQEALLYDVQKPREMAASINLVWEADSKEVKNAADGETIDFANLFYFVNCSSWFERHYDWANRKPIPPYYEEGHVEIAPSTGGIYELRAGNETIGIAINPWNFFGDAKIHGVLFEGQYGCYALVLREFNPGFSEISFPIESCVYGNTYRSFYKCGEEIENPFYGHDDHTEFARLPDTVLIKILSYLPWRHRFRCRRVNRRWLQMANLAIASDTKIINREDDLIWAMGPENLNRLLPIVSQYLEKYSALSTLTYVPDTWNIDFEGIRFPKLGKIRINDEFASLETFFSLLNNCPKLKELTAPILKWELTAPSPITAGPFNQVEKLFLFKTAEVTDPWLFEITSYFPKLTTLHIDGYDYLSSSCLSAIFEKYGKTLTRFKIIHYGRDVQPLEASSMIGALTGLGQCPNVEYCSLVNTAFISDLFLYSLAAGCAKLTALDIGSIVSVTNRGLAALASLPNLKRLNISGVGETTDLSAGISQLARAGHLEQLIAAKSIYPSADCLKICVRHCRHLKLLDVTDSRATLHTHDAKGIIRLYGTYGLNSRLTLRSNNKKWRKQSVRMVQNEVAETATRLFIVESAVPGSRNHIYHGHWLPDEDKPRSWPAPASQDQEDQELFYGWSGNENEQSSDSD